jgi:hypothetical protein
MVDSARLDDRKEEDMAYRVTPQGDILCDTPEEALALQYAIAKGEGGGGKRNESLVNSSEGGSRWNDSRYKEFTAMIKGKGDQQALIELLLESPHGKTDSNIRQALKLDNNLQLAGVTAGLAKNARKVGILSSEELFTKEVMHQGNERILEYKISEAFRTIAERQRGKEKK